MDVSIGDNLAILRRGKSLTQKGVAESLSGYGFKVTSKTIYNWEKGVALPNARQFVALCDILGVDDVLWQFAGVHKGPYAGLNQAGREKARELIDLLFHIDMYRDDAEEIKTPVRLLRLYDIPVSAGAGNFLDESGYEMIEAPASAPPGVDFALRLSGDSMEPLFQDGQMIWIKRQETLNSGEIGVFTYDGDVYCKKLLLRSGGAYLKPLNPAYCDIRINNALEFRTIGKVV